LERKWGIECDDSYSSEISRSPVIYNGILFTRFFYSGANLHAYDAQTGQMLWQFSNNNTDRAPQPIVSEDGVIFYMEGSNPTDLYAVDADTGDELWAAVIAFSLGSSDTAMVTVDGVNDLVYIVQKDGKLFALDKQTGEIVWYIGKAKDKIAFKGDYVLLSGGKIFAAVEIGDEDSPPEDMLRINTSSQDIEIRFDRPGFGSSYYVGQYALCNDRLVVGYKYKEHVDSPKLLVAYDPDSPTIVWQKEFSGVTGTIACNTTRNVIYVPSDPYLYALDAATGEEVWKYEGYGAIYNPSIANGIVYSFRIITCMP